MAVINPLVGGKSSAIFYIKFGNNVVGYKVPMRSESINPSYSNIVNSEALLGKRTPVGTYIGGRTYEGSIDIELFDVGDGVDYFNELLGLLFYTILGSYDDSNEKITFNTTDGPKIDYLVINHESSTVVYSDVYVTGFNFRVPTDGIPTVTLDVRATGQGGSPSADIDKTNIEYSTFYNAENLAFKVSTSDVSNKVYNFELSLNQNLLDFYTYGDLDPQGLEPSTVDLGEITIEYYPEAVETIDLNTALETAFKDGTPLAVPIELDIESPLTSDVAKLVVNQAFVVEYTHDISGNEFITATLGLRVSAEDIELQGVKIETTTGA